MYSSKLVDVYYRLSKKQQRALNKFVRSPYYNKREDVIQLAELMYKTSLSDRKKLKKESVSKIIYPDSPIDLDKIDYLMSFLFKLVERFLVTEQHQEDKIKHNVILMRVYRTMGMHKHFEQSMHKAKLNLGQNKLRDISYHNKLLSIEKEHYEYLSRQKRDINNNLQTLSSTLDIRFLAQKLKDACQLQAHQAVYNQSYDFGLLNSILPYIDKHPHLLKHPAIATYYYFYLASNADHLSDEYFHTFKQLFNDNYTFFKTSEWQDLYTLGVNYCVKKINIGYEHYENELLEMYLIGLNLGYLIQNGNLNHYKFNNICKLALRLNKVDWCRQFIADYQQNLHPKYKQSYVQNALSMLYFAQGNYHETMLSLQEIDQEELFITIDTKILLIKVYYMLGEYDALEALINSFKVFIGRKDILAYHQEIYKNFIRYIQKIIHLSPFDKNARRKLRSEIEQMQKLLEKKWLLECLDN